VGTGVSLFFMATGAILTFAIETNNTEGFNVDAAGVILMVIGLLGLLWSMIAWDDWRPFSRRYDDDVIVRRDYVDDEPVVRRNAVIVDDEAPVRRTVRRVYH
jgi:hypothetical protein